MMNYQLLTAPHPNLRKKAKPINRVDKKLLQNQAVLTQALKDEKDPEGVGLAFTQINKQLSGFAMRTDAQAKKKLDKNIKVLLNPKIIKHSTDKTLGDDPSDPDLEGCLSVPKIYGPIWRWSWIELSYQLLENSQLETYQQRFEDYLARIVLHELDHLNGILFTDRLLEQNQPIYVKEGEEFVLLKDIELLKLY